MCKATSKGSSLVLTPRHILSRPSWDSLGEIQNYVYVDRLALSLEIRPLWRINYLSLHPLLKVACSGTRKLQI